MPVLEAGVNEHLARKKARGLLLSTWFQDGICPDQSPFLDHLEDVIVFARPCLSDGGVPEACSDEHAPQETPAGHPPLAALPAKEDALPDAEFEQGSHSIEALMAMQKEAEAGWIAEQVISPTDEHMAPIIAQLEALAAVGDQRLRVLAEQLKPDSEADLLLDLNGDLLVLAADEED